MSQSPSDLSSDAPEKSSEKLIRKQCVTPSEIYWLNKTALSIDREITHCQREIQRLQKEKDRLGQ